MQGAGIERLGGHRLLVETMLTSLASVAVRGRLRKLHSPRVELAV